MDTHYYLAYRFTITVIDRVCVSPPIVTSPLTMQASEFVSAASVRLRSSKNALRLPTRSLTTQECDMVDVSPLVHTHASFKVIAADRTS